MNGTQVAMLSHSNKEYSRLVELEHQAGRYFVLATIGPLNRHRRLPLRDLAERLGLIHHYYTPAVLCALHSDLHQILRGERSVITRPYAPSGPWVPQKQTVYMWNTTATCTIAATVARSFEEVVAALLKAERDAHRGYTYVDSYQW